MAERFAPAVSGGLNAVMFGADAVVQVGIQHPVAHDVRFLPQYAFVINIERATVEIDRSVIHHIDEVGANLFMEHVGKNRCSFSVEIGLESMADGFVQKNARTAGTQNYGHFTTFGLDGIEQYGRFSYGFLGNFFNQRLREELETHSERTGSAAVFVNAVFLHHTNGG